MSRAGLDDADARLFEPRAYVPECVERTRLCETAGARTAVDLFTGTTRVAQAFKAAGARVTAVDTARYSDVFARTYVATDARDVDVDELAAMIDDLNARPGVAGYFTETFCERSRFFQPHNGARVDAIRDAIEREHAGTPYHAILLTSLGAMLSTLLVTGFLGVGHWTLWFCCALPIFRASDRNSMMDIQAALSPPTVLYWFSATSEEVNHNSKWDLTSVMAFYGLFLWGLLALVPLYWLCSRSRPALNRCSPPSRLRDPDTASTT